MSDFAKDKDVLISRQAAIEAILSLTNCKSVRELYEYVQSKGLTQMWSAGINDAIDAVIALPSAQPEITLEQAIDRLHELGWMQEHDRILTESAQERKKGNWMEKEVLSLDEPGIQLQSCKCSVCERYDTRPYMYFFSEPHFCPNCGAKMEEKAENAIDQ